MVRLAGVLFILFACGLGSSAAAQPKVCGNQAALGSWTLASCPILKDDGAPPDEAAGDGIYTAAVQLSATALLEYKILPTGVWDSSLDIKQVGTCAADGGSMQNDTRNIQVQNPDVSRPTLFFFDSRSQSGGDSVMVNAPAGSCPAWLAVGDFQNFYGPNATAVKLLPQGRGVLAGRFTAAKTLAAGWRWKVVQQTTGTAREYGPTGWAYAPCEAAFTTVSTAVAPGDSVYLIFHAYQGRLQALLSSGPLDGFTIDGAAACQPLDMAAAPVETVPDLGPAFAADLRASDSLDGGPDGADMRRRPGIHCDCQMGARDGAPASSRELLWLSALGVGAWVLRSRQRRRFAVHGMKC